MLIFHIFDLNGYEGAEGRTELENETGMVGMDVKLDDVLGINEYDAVAKLLDSFGEDLRFIFAEEAIVFFNDAFGAVLEFDITGIEIGKISLFVDFSRGNLALVGRLRELPSEWEAFRESAPR